MRYSCRYLDQGRTACDVQRLLSRYRSIGPAHEVIESGVPLQTTAGPLRMQVGLRPKIVVLGRNKTPLDVIRIELRHRPVGFRFVSGSAAAGLIHDVYRVALPQEKLSPALAAVRRSCEVRAGLPAAVDHNDRPGMSLLRWNLKIDV